MNTTGTTSGSWTTYPFRAPELTPPPPVFSGVRVTRSLVLCVSFVDRCLSFWPLCCLFFDLWILITPLLSSNSSYNQEPYDYFPQVHTELRDYLRTDQLELNDNLPLVHRAPTNLT